MSMLELERLNYRPPGIGLCQPSVANALNASIPIRRNPDQFLASVDAELI
jgi:hypothetical protein